MKAFLTDPLTVDHPDAKRVRSVSVDGKVIPMVFACSVIEGWADAYATNDAGTIIVANDAPVRVRHKGTVTIETTEAYRNAAGDLDKPQQEETRP